ncbi:unconventional prefoldin RPB5 interactor-like protein [Anopheles moucheti]|uniref:unconventional prefoldin RPB5 interactor-like protein n=1 Tax=Anopheles moucheti TaxID=186751 RepID=UPI0022F0A94F|nr:unconventional prefoldin RPB5 interactor-like protein [Anopheles moucheti]
MEPVIQANHLYNKTYSDALRTNEAETARWTAYRQEHMELKENLRMYQKAPKADIMIPIGTKAFLPGQLYHTGEVMVSHGCGYFSDCSSEQAQLIADRRIKLAEELLQKYERERSLYNDKLEVPLAGEAFAGGNVQEIVEAYDEEAEKRWREEHRYRVRQNKQKEAKERAANKNAALDISDNELFTKLEEMELLEELEQEMDQLELPTGDDDDDQLGRLMRGELRIHERLRTAHKQTVPESVIDTKSGSSWTAIQQQRTTNEPRTVEEEEPEEQIETTDDEEDENEEADVSAEFSQLLNETKNRPKKEKIKVFQAKLKDVRQRLYQNSMDIVQKIDLYQLHDELEEALDFLLPSKEPEEEPSEQHGSDKSKKVKFDEQEHIKLITNIHQEQTGEEELLHHSKPTLFLPIVHSPECYSSDSKEEIVSPADIYRKFLAEEESLKQLQFSNLKPILKNYNQNRPLSERPTKQAPRKNTPVTSPLPDLLGEVVEHTNADVATEADVQPVQKQQQQKRKVSRFKQQRN